MAVDQPKTEEKISYRVGFVGLIDDVYLPETLVCNNVAETSDACVVLSSVAVRCRKRKLFNQIYPNEEDQLLQPTRFAHQFRESSHR
jgi:hypothetical protein